MQWLLWALLSALFAGLTAVFAKIGIVSINSNLATAIRTTIILVFTWVIALSSSRPADLLRLPFRSWLFLFLSAGGRGAFSSFCFCALAMATRSYITALAHSAVRAGITVLPLFFLG